MRKIIAYILIVLLVCLNLNVISMASNNDVKEQEKEIEPTLEFEQNNIKVVDSEKQNELVLFEKAKPISQRELAAKNLNFNSDRDIFNGANLAPSELQRVKENIRKSNLGYLFGPETDEIDPEPESWGIPQPMSSNPSMANIKVNNDYGWDDQFKPAVAVCPITNNIYVTWLDMRIEGVPLIYFTRSTDQGKTFEQYKTVNDAGDIVGDPDIDVDRKGLIYITWHDNRDGDFDIWMDISIDMGLNWNVDMCVHPNHKTYEQINPTLEVNNSLVKTRVWVVWQDQRGSTGNQYGIYATYKPEDIVDFQIIDPVEVYTNSINRDAMNPDISIDKTWGRVWIVWNEGKVNNNDQNIYLSMSSNYSLPSMPSWSTPVQIDNGPTNTNQTNPVVYVGDETTAYIAWQDDRSDKSWDIYFAKNNPIDVNTTNFSANMRINKDKGDNTNQYTPSIDVNYTTGNIYLTWIDGRNGYHEQYFALSTDSGTSFPNEVIVEDDFINEQVDDANPGNLSGQSIIAVDHGQVHIVYSENRFGNYDIFYQSSTNNGATWSNSLVVNENSTEGIQRNNNQYQIATDTEGGIHIVWEDSSSGNLSFGSDIFYSRSYDSGLTFTPGRLVNTQRDSDQTNPSIAVNDSWIYISWTDAFYGNSIYFSYSKDGGRTFYSPNMRVSNVALSNCDDSVIALNATNAVFIAYEADDTIVSFTFNIYATSTFYNNSLGQFENFPATSINVIDENPFNAFDQTNPTIAVDPTNSNVYLAWEDMRPYGFNTAIYFTRSINNGTTFGTNICINTTDPTGYDHSTPALTVNITGNISVVWSDFRNGEFNVIYTNSSDQGTTFAANKYVAQNANDAQLNPTVDIGANDKIYVTWQDQRNGDWDIYMSSATDPSTAFVAPTKVTDDANDYNQVSPSIAVNITDGIFILWTDNRDYVSDINNKLDIYISSSNDDGATFQKDYCVHTYQGEPAIAVDEYGVVYVVWTDYRFGNYDIFFAKSKVGGQHFEANRIVNDNSDNMRGSPDIAVHNGVIYVVWEDARISSNDYEIMFSKSTDGGETFSANLNITNKLDDQLNPSITVDKNGQLHVVWQDHFIINREEIYYSNSTGGATWATPILVVNSPSDVNLWNPKIAVNDGQATTYIFVVFEDRTNPTDWNVSLSTSTNGGISFGAAAQLNNDVGNTMQLNPAIDADATGMIAMVWEDNRNGHWDIYGSVSLNNGSAFFVDNSIINSTIFNERMPDVTIDYNNNSRIAVIFVTDNGTQPFDNYNVWLTYSGDSGQTFDDAMRADDTGTEVQNQIMPKITTDSNGSAYALWEDYRHGNGDIYYIMNDMSDPFAEAGPNILLPQGTYAEFSAEGSYDNLGIENYTWTFNDGGLKAVYGYNAIYRFDNPGNFVVTLTVTDYYGNQDTDTLTVTVLDLTPPQFGVDTSDSPAYTGDSFIFRRDVTDDYSLGLVQVQWKYGNGGSYSGLQTMTNIGGNIYAYTLNTVADTPLALYYRFRARDTANNWNNETTPVSVPVIDNDKPDINSDTTPTTGNTGGTVTVTIDCTDNILVQTGRVEYWFGTGTHYNYSLSQAGNIFTHLISINATETGPLYYIVSFMDNSTLSNWATQSQKSITIIDTINPTFGVDNSDTVAFIDKTFKFSMTFTDNIDTDSAHVEYWFGTGTHKMMTLTESSGNWDWNTLMIPKALDPLYYIFHFNDTATPANSGLTTQKKVGVFDDIHPQTGTGSGNIETTTGEQFEMYAEFTDNLGIVEVKIFYQKEGTVAWSEHVIATGVNDKYSITNDDLSIDTSQDVTGWRYYLEATDSGNKTPYGTKTSYYTVTVTDNDRPTADAGSDISKDVTETVTFDATGSSDNIGITSYKWTFEEDGVPKSLTGEEPDYKFNKTDTYTVTLNVSDGAGNTHEDTVMVTITTDVKKPVVTLDSPSTNAKIVDDFIVLKWKVSHETPELVTYDLYWGTSKTLTTPKENNLTVKEFELKDLDDGTYYWTVRPWISNINGETPIPLSFTIDTTKEQEYGVMITAETPSPITVGDSTSIDLTVKNTGDGSDAIELTVDKGNFPGTITLDEELKVIDANSSVKIKLTIATTESTPVGNYTITITATSKDAKTSISDSVDIDIQTLGIEQDKDKDGLPDAWEEKYWGDITSQDADGDPDKDGATNLQEYKADTNPTINDEDSDNDKLPDAWEIQHWGDITLYSGNDDPDEDDLTNLQEYNGNTDPKKSDKEDPIKEPKDEEGDDNSWIFIVVAVVVILIVLLVVFMIMKKKGGGEEEKEEPEPTKPVAAPPGAVRPGPGVPPGQKPMTPTTGPGVKPGPTPGPSPGSPTQPQPGAPRPGLQPQTQQLKSPTGPQQLKK